MHAVHETGFGAFVSAYAPSHPCEDWAETRADYLHMLAVQDTALSFGLDVKAIDLDIDLFVLHDQAMLDGDFLNRLNAFTKLSGVLNEFSRSMGQPDLYPFVVSKPVVKKLWFIDRVVIKQRECHAGSTIKMPEAQ